MLHCSLELAFMTLGYAVNDRTTFTAKFTDLAAMCVLCGATTEDTERVYGWFGNWTAEKVFKEHHADFDCERCLVALDAAREGRVLT
jgi:uncharacterized protein YjlB